MPGAEPDAGTPRPHTHNHTSESSPGGHLLASSAALAPDSPVIASVAQRGEQQQRLVGHHRARAARQHLKQLGRRIHHPYEELSPDVQPAERRHERRVGAAERRAEEGEGAHLRRAERRGAVGLRAVSEARRADVEDGASEAEPRRGVASAREGAVDRLCCAGRARPQPHPLREVAVGDLPRQVEQVCPVPRLLPAALEVEREGEAGQPGGEREERVRREQRAARRPEHLRRREAKDGLVAAPLAAGGERGRARPRLAQPARVADVEAAAARAGRVEREEEVEVEAAHAETVQLGDPRLGDDRRGGARAGEAAGAVREDPDAGGGALP
eukprot:CAMPEP_0202790720 /NCGR_PEP_ID=MMETSP1388-20130828/80117_1 /ASSEMBLY_ACC=CAM_ASM_000864 /TAXON_ID=37098 /ORGANISM="Isochrysis sp, Strain CCMP1244" /LENGTH=327 /DNA_ID=CAMNT_0049460463 /DNA_START=41 /DNA_END=1021 /DNA_ORIENTATION=+